MNPVVHFEMPYHDRERMADFYTKAFGWKTNLLGADMGDYVTVQTAETDENRMLKEAGRINGGFFKRTADAQYPSVVISVDDIQAAIEKIKGAGGTIVAGETHGEPVDIPGIGKYVSMTDTEGNRVGILQPSKDM